MFITQRYTLHLAILYVKCVKINRSCQLALDGVVDTDMDYNSNDAGSSPTFHLLFSSVFFLLLLDSYHSLSEDDNLTLGYLF